MREFEIIEQHMKKQRCNGRLLHNRRFRLTDTDKKLIRKQLKTFTLEELLDAITATHSTEWNVGINPDGKKYLCLRLCISDDTIQKRMDKFEEIEDALAKISERQEEEAQKEVIAPEPSTITDTKAAYREALRNSK